MNEAETKIVKRFIGLAEDKYDDVKNYWADVRDSHEYEALKALAEDKPEADGWIKWEGGYPPVHGDIKVEVRGVGQKTQLGRAGHFLWSNDYGGEYDITHYRIVEEPKKPKKQTLRDIAKQKYSFFKFGHGNLSSQEMFNCLSDYLEQEEC